MTTVQSLYPQSDASISTAGILWSTTSFHAFDPASAHWSAGVVTAVSINHNLTSSDIVSFESTNVSSLWNITNVAATVIDKDTFTVPLVVNPGVFPAQVDDYPTEIVSVTCKSHSKIASKPSIIQIETLPSGTNVKVQSKVHQDASWISVADLTPADGASQIFFDPRVNFIRCIRTAGTGQPTAFTQD